MSGRGARYYRVESREVAGDTEWHITDPEWAKRQLALFGAKQSAAATASAAAAAADAPAQFHREGG